MLHAQISVMVMESKFSYRKETGQATAQIDLPESFGVLSDLGKVLDFGTLLEYLTTAATQDYREKIKKADREIRNTLPESEE